MKITIEINSFDELVNIKEFFKKIEDIEITNNREDEDQIIYSRSNIEKISIDGSDLFISRTRDALLERNIHTLGELSGFSENELFRMQGIGVKAINEIKSVLSRYKLRLKPTAYEEKQC